MTRWYAIRAKPRQEKKALTHLLRQNFECHLPMARERRPVRGRYTQILSALFPGYLFARLTMGEQNLAPIRSTQGVIGLTHFGQCIPPLPEGFVEQLQACDQNGSGIAIGAEEWVTGQKLLITGGPFAGLQTVFAAHDGAARVVVLLDILGRANRLPLPTHHVRALGRDLRPC